MHQGRCCNAAMAAQAAGFRRRVFVVMPFGEKEVRRKPRVELSPDSTDAALKVDFNAVYEKLFKPALETAGLQPFRAMTMKRPEKSLTTSSRSS